MHRLCNLSANLSSPHPITSWDFIILSALLFASWVTKSIEHLRSHHIQFLVDRHRLFISLEMWCLFEKNLCFVDYVKKLARQTRRSDQQCLLREKKSLVPHDKVFPSPCVPSTSSYWFCDTSIKAYPCLHAWLTLSLHIFIEIDFNAVFLPIRHSVTPSFNFPIFFVLSVKDGVLARLIWGPFAIFNTSSSPFFRKPIILLDSQLCLIPSQDIVICRPPR